MNETFRRAGSMVLSLAGWTATIVLSVLRATGDLSADYGSLVVAVASIAIAATVVRSRYRLQDTVAGAMRAGWIARDNERE